MEVSLTYPYRGALDASLSWPTHRGRGGSTRLGERKGRGIYKYCSTSTSAWLLGLIVFIEVIDDNILTIGHRESHMTASETTSTYQTPRTHLSPSSTQTRPTRTLCFLPPLLLPSSSLPFLSPLSLSVGKWPCAPPLLSGCCGTPELAGCHFIVRRSRIGSRNVC